MKSFERYIRIYRRTVSNLHIREQILRCGRNSDYTIGPTLIWTETPDDLAIFTTHENYTNYIGFESSFANPRSPNYLTKIIRAMRMKKGTILIKESTIIPDPKKEKTKTTNVPVHFCAYRVDGAGTFTIFDPAWHKSDPGIYSTTAFYDSLDAFDIKYQHAELGRTHHWQNVVENDVFCQTWSLRWLMRDMRRFPLPKTPREARVQLSSYIVDFTRYIRENIDECMSVFPSHKLEGNDPQKVFDAVLRNSEFILTEFH